MNEKDHLLVNICLLIGFLEARTWNDRKVMFDLDQVASDQNAENLRLCIGDRWLCTHLTQESCLRLLKIATAAYDVLVDAGYVHSFQLYEDDIDWIVSAARDIV